jgi:thiol-disulfide isomerase/thioredoxin
METLPAQDRPAAPARRRVPPGLLAAALLASVVVVVAVVVAVRSGGPGSTTAPGATVPPAAPAAAGGATTPPFTIRTGLGRGPDLTGATLPEATYTSFGSDDPIRLADFRAAHPGRPLVINFWSSTCAPCVTEMPELQRVHEELGDRVAFLGLDVQDGVENGRFMLDKTGVRYDNGRDTYGDVLIKLGGVVLPTTVVVGADGTIRSVHSGQLSGDELRRLLAPELGTP